jgi:hypothetical protein
LVGLHLASLSRLGRLRRRWGLRSGAA